MLNGGTRIYLYVHEYIIQNTTSRKTEKKNFNILRLSQKKNRISASGVFANNDALPAGSHFKPQFCFPPSKQKISAFERNEGARERAVRELTNMCNTVRD